MAKVGRNDPCPCNSGKKFKKCHGALERTPTKRLPGPSQPEFEAMLRRARAEQVQRERQQGRGRPIITAAVGEQRMVAVRNTLFTGDWKTFPDFLLHYLKERMGRDWGQGELAKPEAERHQLFALLAAVSRELEQAPVQADGTKAARMTGGCHGVLSLAYDLYLIEHHAEDARAQEEFQDLLRRLRMDDQFLGARHEARAAGVLLRAGFTLTWEDERVRQEGGHGEFVATWPGTGRAFWVECKARQADEPNARLRVGKMVRAALKKATDLERLVFVELGMGDGGQDAEEGAWAGEAINQLRQLQDRPDAADLPPALVLFSNYPERWQLDTPMQRAGFVPEGFKTDRYRAGELVDLDAAIAAREQEPELQQLWESLRQHSHIPSTFDGSLPGVDPKLRLILGQGYELPDGTRGTLEDATVMEQSKQAAGILRLEDGRRVITYFDLSEPELEAWRRHPDTFFGELRPHHAPAKNAMDLYEFFLDGYRNTPKETLLQLMAHHSNIEALRTLSQPELAKHYAKALARSVGAQHPPQVPVWQQRLRKPKKPG